MDTLADNLLDGAGDTNGAEDTLADDLLDGAEEIAEFLFGNAQKKKKRAASITLPQPGSCRSPEWAAGSSVESRP